jgi:DNA polymerase I-like protein with 3'-5' exonuclease and polymerase domains
LLPGLPGSFARPPIFSAKAPKGTSEATDWNRFNMLTEYRVCGSAADLLKLAMVNIAPVMPGDCHLVATVHDELILDAPTEMAKQYCNMTRYAMEEAFVEMFGHVVPVEVEAKVCTNWAEK